MFITALILLFVLLLVGLSYAIRSYTMPTEVMKPFINPGDGVYVDEIRYKLGFKINRFDVVVVNQPDGANRILIKGKAKFIERVIGLPKERIEIKQGNVYINNFLLTESFDRKFDKCDFGPITIPENEYFLLGDNRLNDFDSRVWEKPTVKKKNVYGKVFRVVPKEKWEIK